MLEYIPGKYAHRPVSADGYMFIHCIFVGFKGEFKGKGHASGCLTYALRKLKSRVCWASLWLRGKGPFMAKKDIFVKKGFHVVDAAKPDFELLALKFDDDAPNPKFTILPLAGYGEGLTIIRSPQCPYSVKNVDAILVTAKKMGLPAKLVDLADAESAQKSPCAFGTFCIINDGKILCHHPISNTRFQNIMEKGK